MKGGAYWREHHEPKAGPLGADPLESPETRDTLPPAGP